MSHLRFWAPTFGLAVCGGFIAIERFAFAPGAALWITLGVAAAAVFFAVAAGGVALARHDHVLSGLSVLSAVVAGSTVIATRTFTSPSSLWLSFAGGVALLLGSVAALALHEWAVGAETRSWSDWLAQTWLAFAGAVVVLSTYAWAPDGEAVSPRWLAFAIGIAALVVLVGSIPARRIEGVAVARRSLLATAGASGAVAIALVVTMAALSGDDARWTEFALGCALVGISLLASTIRELTAIPVRHDLQVTRAESETGTSAARAA